jgi:lipopolysaccharide/colanic/teichoic acid biosynthesis glycosyltransferase
MTPVESLEQPATDHDASSLLASTSDGYDRSSTGLLDEPRESSNGGSSDEFEAIPPAPSHDAQPAASTENGSAADPRDCSAAYRALERRFAEARNHFVILPAGNRSRLYLGMKRLLDIVGAIFFIILFSPFLLVTYVVLSITTKGKPIFVQERVGLCGRHFRMYKFRTMRLDAEKMQHLVKNEKDGPIFKNVVDPRITKIGRYLRSTSIDEMPQLFNVLFGDMSLVGPRPPIPKEVAKYQPWQRARLRLKPGLTCLWQVSGRSEIGFEDWVRMDIWYSEHQNMGTDIKLLAKTPVSVISRRGAY